MAELGAIRSAIGGRSDAASATGSLHAKMSEMLNGTRSLPVAYGWQNATGATGTSPWVEIAAANVLTGHVLIWLYPRTESSGPGIAYDMTVEFGEGAPGSEVVVYRTLQGRWATDAGIQYGFAIVPPFQITANARFVARSIGTANLLPNYRALIAPRPL